MATWKQQTTASQLRAVTGNIDTQFDTQIQAYIDSMTQDIEQLTGISFDYTVGDTVITYTNTLARNVFVLAETVLLAGPYLTVTSLESSYIQPTPTWRTLELNNDYTAETSEIERYKNVITKFAFCNKMCKGQQIRITGQLGFSELIPNDLKFMMAIVVSSYYVRLRSGIGVYDVDSEKSLTRTVTYIKNGLSSAAIFAPTSIDELESIIKKYIIHPKYAF